MVVFNYSDEVTINRYWEYMISEQNGKVKMLFKKKRKYESKIQLCSVYNIYKRFLIKLTEYEWMSDSTTNLFLGFTLSNGIKFKFRKEGEEELREEVFVNGVKYEGKFSELISIGELQKQQEEKLRRKLDKLDYSEVLDKHLQLRLTDNPNIFKTNLYGFGFTINGDKIVKVSCVKLLSIMRMYGEVVARITLTDSDGKELYMLAKIKGSSQIDDRKELMVIDHTKDGSFYRFHFKYPEFLDLLAKELIYNCTF